MAEVSTACHNTKSDHSYNCLWNNTKLRLTLYLIGIFLIYPIALDGSDQDKTIASSPGRDMKVIANASDFVVSSFDVAILLMSMGLELRFDRKYRSPLSLTNASSLPVGENAAH